MNRLENGPERTNRDVAAVLFQLGDLTDIATGDGQRARAYRRAAQSVETCEEPLARLAEEGRLQELPGVGQAIAALLEEILASGTCELLEHLQAEVPHSVLALLEIPGLGPKTLHVLYRGRGIENLDQLQNAAEEGLLRDLPGMGPKREQNLLRAIESYRRRKARTPAAQVEPIAYQIVRRLADVEATVHAAIAGSLRRGVETVGNLNLVASSDDPGAVAEAFATFPELEGVEVADEGERGLRAAGRLAGEAAGVPCILRIVAPQAFHVALQYETGSIAHNARLREIAEERGYRLHPGPFGLFRRADASHDVETGRVEVLDEHHLYRRLGMAYLYPELREDLGEIEAAQRGQIPKLIKLRDLRGNLHTHTRWSDGKHSLEAMVSRAQELGYEYLAITDHSPLLAVARGLDSDRLRMQIEEIRTLQENLPMLKVLTGVEVDILPDGALDLPDELLADLDVVVASVHTRFGMDKASMTRRLIEAMRSPHVDILGHPTGRLLGQRDPYPVNAEALVEAAAETGTVLEINASPDRMDIPDTIARRAVEAGVLLAINSDAHAVDGFDVMWYGIRVARRAWVPPEAVVNTWPWDRLRDFLSTPKARRGDAFGYGKGPILC